MNSDIVDLKSFYNSLLGRLAERAIGMALASLWVKLPQERLVGMGYVVPWLDRFGADAERVFCFMPAMQGAIAWPAESRSATALVYDDQLPLADSSIDRFLLVHSLEHSEIPRETLNEIWRVLAPGGSVIVVAPNRRGVWARIETTPFATGRPFSRRQLTALMREANFTPTGVGDALYFPPSERRMLLRFNTIFERIGRRFWPIFSGVVIVEGQKRLFQGLPAKSRAARRVFVPVLSPQGATMHFHKDAQ